MEQHITKQQWEELFAFKFPDEWRGLREEYFTIGQMIEFLGDDWIDLCNNTHSRMTVEDYMPVEEMCDNLWEAVKYKLNNK